jgi:hypothetical protein
MLENNVVSENGYITEVKLALLRAGFWGQPVRKLVEELRDHFLAETKALEAQGHSLPEARRMAAAALGAPATIAAEWSGILQTKSWMARHPWLTICIGMLGIVAYYTLIVTAFVNLSGWHDYYAATNQMKLFPFDGWLYLFNWLPWDVGMVYLAWRAIRFPSGWKALFVGCLALGLATSAFAASVTLPHEGDLRGGSMSILGQTWTIFLLYPLISCFYMWHPTAFYQQHFGMQHWMAIWSDAWLCPGVFRLLFPVLACMAARWIVPRLQVFSTA